MGRRVEKQCSRKVAHACNRASLAVVVGAADIALHLQTPEDQVHGVPLLLLCDTELLLCVFTTPARTVLRPHKSNYRGGSSNSICVSGRVGSCHHVSYAIAAAVGRGDSWSALARSGVVGALGASLVGVVGGGSAARMEIPVDRLAIRRRCLIEVMGIYSELRRCISFLIMSLSAPLAGASVPEEATPLPENEV